MIGVAVAIIAVAIVGGAVNFGLLLRNAHDGASIAMPVVGMLAAVVAVVFATFALSAGVS